MNDYYKLRSACNIYNLISINNIHDSVQHFNISVGTIWQWYFFYCTFKYNSHWWNLSLNWETITLAVIAVYLVLFTQLCIHFALVKLLSEQVPITTDLKGMHRAWTWFLCEYSKIWLVISVDRDRHGIFTVWSPSTIFISTMEMLCSNAR